MCFPVGDLFDTNGLTRRLDALQTSSGKRLLDFFFFSGHFCFLATGRFYTDLYLLPYGNRSTQVLFMASDLWRKRHKMT